MATEPEDLSVLQTAADIADEIWRKVVRWDEFARDVVGTQFARAADSIGANIAEAHGRSHHGDKLRFLHYARGSLYVTKYWLNRALARALMSPADGQGYALRLSQLARQVNTFSGNLKRQQQGEAVPSRTMREDAAEYPVPAQADMPGAIFAPAELDWLQSLPTAAESANL